MERIFWFNYFNISDEPESVDESHACTLKIGATLDCEFAEWAAFEGAAMYPT